LACFTRATDLPIIFSVSAGSRRSTPLSNGLKTQTRKCNPTNHRVGGGGSIISETGNADITPRITAPRLGWLDGKTVLISIPRRWHGVAQSVPELLPSGRICGCIWLGIQTQSCGVDVRRYCLTHNPRGITHVRLTAKAAFLTVSLQDSPTPQLAPMLSPPANREPTFDGRPVMSLMFGIPDQSLRPSMA
jgi:hypothetical protein